MASSSPELYWDFATGGGFGRSGLMLACFGTGKGVVGSGAGTMSEKKFSTGIAMSIGTAALGITTRVGSGSSLTSMSAGGRGGVSGISSWGGGGGGSKVAVSISRIVRSGISVVTVNRRATPSTASRMAEAAMPVMVDLKFNVQISTSKEETGVLGKGNVCD